MSAVDRGALHTEVHTMFCLSTIKLNPYLMVIHRASHDATVTSRGGAHGANLGNEPHCAALWSFLVQRLVQLGYGSDAHSAYNIQ